MARNRKLTTSQDSTLPLARDLFLTAKQAEGLSPRTLATYTAAVDRFCAWLQNERDVSAVNAITAQHVRAYIVHLQSFGYKSSYVHDLLRPVKTWLRFLHAEAVMPVDVFARVAMPKQDTPVLSTFTAQQVRALLAACDESQDPLRDRAIVLVLLDTGVRAQELCDLTLGDVDAKTGAVIVRRGKGGKGRLVYIGAAARKALLKYSLTRQPAGNAAPLFPALTGGALTPNSLLLLCRRLGERADVPHCSPHVFRRFFAITSLRNGCDLARLALLMGHADTQVLRRYLPFVADDLRDAHAQFGPVDGLLGKGRTR